MHTSATATDRRVLAGALVLLAAASAMPLSAQNRSMAPVPLPLEERVRGTLNRSSGVFEGRYYVDYTFPVSEGAGIAVLLESSTPVSVVALSRTASGQFMLPGLDVRTASFSASRFPAFKAGWTGEARLRVMARDPGATVRYTLCVQYTFMDTVDPDDCQKTSSIMGLEIAPFGVGQRLNTEGIDHADQAMGWGVRAGIGLGERFQVFGQYSSEIADQGVPEDQESPMYDLTSIDAGARLYLTGFTNPFRPYIMGKYGWREREEAHDSDYVYYGRSWGAGVGAQFFLGRSIAFDIAGTYDSAQYTEITHQDSDRVTLDNPFKATSLRADLGLSLFLRPAFLMDFLSILGSMGLSDDYDD